MQPLAGRQRADFGLEWPVVRLFRAPVHTLGGVIMNGTLQANDNQRERVARGTPTSAAHRFTLIARGPTHRGRTLAFNDVEHRVITVPIPPARPFVLRLHPIGNATTILKVEAWQIELDIRGCPIPRDNLTPISGTVENSDFDGGNRRNSSTRNRTT